MFPSSNVTFFPSSKTPVRISGPFVCTMGPRTNDPDVMRGLIQNGMDIARFNFSHGDHEEQKMRMDMIKQIRDEEKVPVAILLDTKGPEIRTGVLEDGKRLHF